jgi:hypothetical protein
MDNITAGTWRQQTASHLPAKQSKAADAICMHACQPTGRRQLTGKKCNGMEWNGRPPSRRSTVPNRAMQPPQATNRHEGRPDAMQVANRRSWPVHLSGQPATQASPSAMAVSVATGSQPVHCERKISTDTGKAVVPSTRQGHCHLKNTNMVNMAPSRSSTQ